MQKFFVTGSEGFIGSHLVEKLLTNGHQVTALVLYNFNSSIGWLDNIQKKKRKKLKIVLGDIRDTSTFDKYLKNIDCVIHLASLISIPYSYIAAKSYYETNVMGLLNLLELCLKNKVPKIIHTSTSEVYGTAETNFISEKHILKAQSPYSASKISADKLFESYILSHGIKGVVMRPFNTFGPRQSQRAIIPSIIGQILTQNNHLELGNINTQRDFNFIEDTVSAYMCAIEKKIINGRVYNIGSGETYKISEIVKYISDIVGKRIKIKIKKERLRPSKSEVYRLRSDSKLIKKELNWKPKYIGKDGFKKALVKTVEWYKKNQNKLKLYNDNLYKI